MPEPSSENGEEDSIGAAFDLKVRLAASRFSAREAVLRVLDSMRDSVAHQMRQRLSERREHVTFQALLTARGVKDDLPPKHLGGVADRALKGREQQAGGQQSEPVDVLKRQRAERFADLTSTTARRVEDKLAGVAIVVN